MSDDRPEPLKRDLLAQFVRHRTAANLLMAIMIISGLYGLWQMNTQFFPNIAIETIIIEIDWPGASASDIDENIVQAIEPEVRFLDDVDTVRSSSFEGRAIISIEYEPGTDMQSALSNVETAVGQVTTLPESSEAPVIRRFVVYEPLSRLVLSGPFTERALKETAERLRDELLRRGIDRVDLIGARDEEIWVDIRPEVLRELNLTLEEVAQRIRAISQDLPSGDISGATRRQLRSLGLLRTARDVRDVEIRALDDGRKIYLRDIADVGEAFDEDGRLTRRNGQTAIELFVQRSATGDALQLADVVEEFLNDVRPTLPPTLTLEQYEVRADLIRSRINLLLTNGAGGLVLVLAILFLFLNMRVAFFVALGIPISLAATMLVMYASGQSINMVSLFGLIMAIGIIVDDAIVVGEHSETRFRSGDGPYLAAEQGARRMLAPVVSSSMTTIAAFLPLLLIGDVIGKIIEAIPLVIIAVIVASLVECFFVLPGHMRDAFLYKARGPWRFRVRFDDAFDRFRNGLFERVVRRCIEWRYATVATAVAVFVVMLGLVLGGRIGFVFFPPPEVDNVFANAEFTAGTPRGRTIRMLDELERAMNAAEAELTDGEGGLVRIAVQRVGTAVGTSQIEVAMQGDHVGGLNVELIPTDQREITAAEFIDAWRRHVRPMAGLVSFSIRPAQAGPPGRDVDVRLSGADPVILKQAAEAITERLRRLPGVKDIEDDLPYGKREMILELTPQGRALGFTTETVGQQVRNAFEGAIARRFARGDEEVLIRVQYPRGAVDSNALHTLYLRSPAGRWVPLSSVVTIREDVGFSRIRREDGVREVAIVGDIDTGVTTTTEVLATLEREGLPEIATRYGVQYRFAGRAEEQEQTFKDMTVGAIIGLSLIYIILAWVFASYVRPFVVMAVIPLGFIGAVIGHMLLGFDLTILSMIALVGLSGIVVNDSIILITTIHERMRDGGESLYDAIVGASKDRLRAVILTSGTTIGGLTPLMFETDLQAQFLIPMAITIVFGLMIATLLILLVVPSLTMIQGDLRSAADRLRGRKSPAPAE